jgi:hypothetical protein
MVSGRKLALTALLVMTALALGSCGDDEEENAEADVTVGVCAHDSTGGRPNAEGRIINNSSQDSAYAFRVTFIDTAGNKVSEGAVTVAKVPPGGQATWRTEGVTAARGPLVCDLSEISRTAVP